MKTSKTLTSNCHRRNPTVEGFRILLMALIVFYHGTAVFSGSEFFVNATMVATHWCVNAFVAISGWYGMRFKPKKVLAIVGTIGFYSFLRYFLGLLAFPGIPSGRFVLSGGWFGDSYVALMFLAPLLDSALCQAYALSPHGEWKIWGMFAAVVFFNWLPLHGVFPGVGLFSGHHSVLTMCFVYFSARTLHLALERKNVSCHRLLPILACVVYCFVSGILAVLDVSGRSPFPKGSFGGVTYDAPHVVFLGVSIVAFVATRNSLNLNLGRFFAFLAPSMFGIYLFHMTVFSILNHISLQKSPMLAMAFSAIAFVICLLVDIARRCLGGLLQRILDSKAI